MILHLLEDGFLVHLHGRSESCFLDRPLVVRLHGGIALEYLSANFQGIHCILFGKLARDEGLDGSRRLHGIAAIGLGDLLRRIARLLQSLARRRRLSAFQDKLGQDEDGVAVDAVTLGTHMDGKRREIDEGELVHRRRSARQKGATCRKLRRKPALRIDDSGRKARMAAAEKDDELAPLIFVRVEHKEHHARRLCRMGKRTQKALCQCARKGEEILLARKIGGNFLPALAVLVKCPRLLVGTFAALLDMREKVFARLTRKRQLRR